MSTPLSWSDLSLHRRPLSALGGERSEPSAGSADPSGSASEIVTVGGVLSGGTTYALDARRFGARGDGVADDTDALEAAIAAMPLPRIEGGVYLGGGGVLTLAAGTYRITRTLRLPSNLTLRGEGHAPNTTEDQGATLIDASAVAVALLAESASNVVVEDLAIKNPSEAAVRFSGVRHGAIRRVSVFGAGVVRTGLHLRDATMFSTVEQCNVNGLVGVLGPAGEDLCVGLLVEGESNEISVLGGNIRQNATNIRVVDSNGALVLGVNCEGHAGSTGLHGIGAEITCIRARFEGVGRAVLLETGLSGETVFAGFSNGYHPNTLVGIQVESEGALVALVEPMLHRCERPVAGTYAARLAPYTMMDPARRGLSVGSLRLNGHDEGGLNGILAGSGRLVLEMAGGNPLELRTPAGAVQWFAYYGDPNAEDNPLVSLLSPAPLGSMYTRLSGEAAPARLWVKTGAAVWTPLEARAAEAVTSAAPVVTTRAVDDDRIDPRQAPWLAVGDGVADDTNALQGALDEASRRLKRGEAARVRLPAGTYLITRPLYLESGTTAPWSLTGEPGTTLVYAGPAGEALLTLAHASRYTVQDLELNAAGLARSALELVGTGTFGNFVRCSFLNPRDLAGAAAFALFRPEAADGYQQDLRFEQCTFAARSAVADGFSARHTSAGRFSFEGCHFLECHVGLSLVHNLGVILRGCMFTGIGTGISASDSQLVVEGCTLYTARVLWQSMGSATLSGCAWVPGVLPEDGIFLWTDGRLNLLGCDLLNQNHVGGPPQLIGIGQHAALFSRGSRFTDATSLPVVYYGQRVGGPEGSDDQFKGQQSWDWGRGPAIDVAGDIGVSYSRTWTAMPSLVLPTPRLVGDSLPIQADQVSAGHTVLSEGQLSRQIARFRVPVAVWTAAATEQLHVLARPFHRTRIVGAWIDVLSPFAGIAAPKVSLGLEGQGDCDTLLRAAPCDVVGLIGATMQDLGRGLDPETSVQGGLLVGWTRGQQERLALRLTAAEPVGSGSATRLSSGELEVVVAFEVLG